MENELKDLKNKCMVYLKEMQSNIETDMNHNKWETCENISIGEIYDNIVSIKKMEENIKVIEKVIKMLDDEFIIV